MPKRENQKLKLLYLAKIFQEKTDENNGITLKEIESELAKYDIAATRKTLYSDIELLRDFGMDIAGVQSQGTYYYSLLNHDFELPELKLLVDAVQSSKFITVKKSDELIKKIEGLASIYEAKELQRQVVINDRIKTMNESIYYNVDTLNAAINSNSAIDFCYYEWNVEKKLELRQNGEKKNISPWVLIWADENYYLIAYDADAETIKHYRVDKMGKIRITGTLRQGREQFENFNAAKYAKKVFGMFGGEEENVTLEFENRLIGVVIDRFGKDIMIIPKDIGHFRVHVDVEVSTMFISWVMGLGSGAKIVGPDSVLDMVQGEIQRMQKQYKSDHKK